jgi:hypothetical protein
VADSESMERGRSILAKLKQRPWVDPEVDFDTVMAGLAEGQPAARLIARARHDATFGVIFAPGDAALLDELIEIARAPYRAVAWPDPPDVQVSRIIADFERTTGRTLALAWRWEQYPDDGFWVCDYAVDGDADRGGFGAGWSDDPEEDLARLADQLVEQSLSEVIWGGWPLCHHHPTRPMWPKVNSEGVASWVCEVDPDDQVRIGHLGR